jgi:hypothetical protein
MKREGDGRQMLASHLSWFWTAFWAKVIRVGQMAIAVVNCHLKRAKWIDLPGRLRWLAGAQSSKKVAGQWKRCQQSIFATPVVAESETWRLEEQDAGRSRQVHVRQKMRDA